jgi:ABC-type Na+ efflux pump permease subunit
MFQVVPFLEVILLALRMIFSSMCATSPAHLLFDLVVLLIFGENEL